MKTHIVIPIGVGAPGTPVQEYLEQSVNSVLNQTSKDFILTVAADINVPERCIKFLKENDVEIKYFEPFSYFRKGGIWKKIFDTWEEKDSEWVAFLHYDDLWDSEKLKIQTELMKNKNLLGSWSEAYTINREGHLTSSDLSFASLSSSTVGSRTNAFGHSIIVNRKAMMNSGIMCHEELWSANFEDLWALYFHKLRNVEKAPGAKIFWRSHDLNVSHTMFEHIPDTIHQRNVTGYTLDETLQDEKKIDMNKLKNEIRQIYENS